MDKRKLYMYGRPHDYYSTIEYNNALQVVAGCEALLKTYKQYKNYLLCSLDMKCYATINWSMTGITHSYATQPNKYTGRVKHYE